MGVRVGSLALQGGFAAHGEALRRVGATTCEVRRPGQLDELDGLVIPGGESTTLLNLMQDAPWLDRLREFSAAGGAVFVGVAVVLMRSRSRVAVRVAPKCTLRRGRGQCPGWA